MPSRPKRAFHDMAGLPRPSLIRRITRFRPGRRTVQAVTATASSVEVEGAAATGEGGGLFGQWTVDEAGLPAYDYDFDQYADGRAAFPNTENRSRRDHWHQVGNQRITALASNDGVVQVYVGDRGGLFLNRFEAWDSDHAGGGWLAALVARLLRALAWLLARLRQDPYGQIKPYAAPASRSRWETRLRGVEAEASAQTGSGSTGHPTHPRGGLSAEQALRLREAEGVRAQAGEEPDNPLAVAGGFSYVDDGAEVWASAYRYRPDGTATRRRFGIGYFETETTHRRLVIGRRVYAPYGDAPALLVDVTLENRRSEAVTLRHYEYWDVNVHQLQLEWLRSGSFAASSDAARRALNRNFETRAAVDGEGGALRFHQRAPQPPPVGALPPELPAAVDWEPPDIVLVDLSGQPDGWYTDRAAFFGAGGPRQPDAVGQRRESMSGPEAAVESMPNCLALRRDLRLEAGERRTLRYAFGAVRPGDDLTFLEAYRQGDPFADTLGKWKDALPRFRTGEDPALERETTWHAANLLSATTYNAFHGVHVVPQGSAYLYSHGADGAPRDQALFTLPLSYVNPELARDQLRLIMRLTDGRSGQISYAFAGHGYLSNGLNLHNRPSDLDLFFLLAMTEYLAATRDVGFLEEVVPFYPPDEPHAAPGLTVLDHIRFAITHLFEGIGVGENGLLKIGSGDWSDSIVLESAVKDGPFGVAYQHSKEGGESVPNSQMALYVLPLLAALLRLYAADVSQTLFDGRLDRLKAAVERQWNPRGWYNRAILRDVRNAPVVVDRLDLEAQVWGLISGAARGGGHEALLLDRVITQLDDPSPIGASLLPGGMVWPAISQLLTWGYTLANRGELAWRSLYRHSFTAHAERYPHIWYGIWSGPDGINGRGAGELEGWTWNSPMTPMTDFPVMNANPDAMALLGLLRVCGIQPSAAGDGLTIRPLVPRERFVLDVALLRVEVEEGKLRGEYRPRNDGFMTLTLFPPHASVPKVVTVKMRKGEPFAFEA